MSKICVVKAIANLESEKYTTLSVWGNPVIYYPVKAAVESNIFDDIYIQTQSPYIKYLVKSMFGDSVHLEFNQAIIETGDILVELSANAVTITADTLRDAFTKWDGESTGISAKENVYYEHFMETNKCLQGTKKVNTINLFVIHKWGCLQQCQKIIVNKECALVVNDNYDFELALVLIRKREHERLLDEKIKMRIEQKKDILSYCALGSKSCCLIGHSILDEWKIHNIGGYSVRNCGIGGITSVQYNQLILSKEMLNCSDALFVVMHGINDIPHNWTCKEIFESIIKTINYIRERSNSPIIFLKCMHVNGRMERSNKKIDCLNSYISNHLPVDIVVVDLSSMDDAFGNLKQEYTVDGLHLNDSGYDELQRIVEDVIIQYIDT